MSKTGLRMSAAELDEIQARFRRQKHTASASEAVEVGKGIAKQSKALKTHANAKSGGAEKSPANGVERWQALGRLPDGELNKTELAYKERLQGLLAEGRILWFKFHPFNIRLAKNTHYRVDVLVLASDCVLELHEIKGGYTSEKGQMKIKLAAEALPVFRMVKAELLRGEWRVSNFDA